MQKLQWLGFGVIAAMLAACGGGGGNSVSESVPPPAATTPEGVYEGSLSGATSSNYFQMLMLDDGEYWAPYGVSSGGTFYLAGFIQGSGTSDNGSFTSSNGRDFGVYPAASGSLTASYVAGTSVQGAITTALGPVNFSGTTAGIAPYSYNTPAVLSSIVGAWTMTALDGSSVAVSIGSSGAFSANNAGCLSSGTVLPRPGGKNVFDVVMTAGASPCAIPGQTGRGIAIHAPIEGTAFHQLLVGLVGSDRSAGSALVGIR